MKNALAFDTLKYTKRLKEAGFTEQQAETLAEEQSALINDQLATKADIAEVKREIEELRAEVKRDMKELELRLKHDLTVRLGLMMAASIAIVAALVKLL